MNQDNRTNHSEALSMREIREREYNQGIRSKNIILADDQDPKRASLLWLFLGLGALVIEFMLMVYFLINTFKIGTFYAILLSAVTAASLALGLAALLELYYEAAQRVFVELRRFMQDVFDNLRNSNPDVHEEKSRLEKKKDDELARYNNIRKLFLIIGIVSLISGVVAFAIERVLWDIDPERDTISWLAYIINLGLSLGGAFISASALHYFFKRNEEVDRISVPTKIYYHLRADGLNLATKE